MMVRKNVILSVVQAVYPSLEQRWGTVSQKEIVALLPKGRKSAGRDTQRLLQQWWSSSYQASPLTNNEYKCCIKYFLKALSEGTEEQPEAGSNWTGAGADTQNNVSFLFVSFLFAFNACGHHDKGPSWKEDCHKEGVQILHIKVILSTCPSTDDWINKWDISMQWNIIQP